MRPKRTKKLTKLSDFFYPTKKKGKKLLKKPNLPSKSPQKSLTAPQVKSTSQIVATTPSPRAQRSSITPEIVNSPVAAIQEAVPELQNSKNKLDDQLDEIYTNTKLPSSYSGDLKKYILQKESISRHKRKLNIFKRRKVFVLGPWVAIQADTAFYIRSARKNDGYKYILGETYIHRIGQNF
jgi:hypothetical protein